MNKETASKPPKTSESPDDSDDGEETWEGKPHRMFENDPKHDPYPQRHYSAAGQKKIQDEIDRQKKLIQEASRRAAGRGGKYIPEEKEPDAD